MLPKRESCPSSEDCAPQKLTSSVLLECNSRPETPKILAITLEFASKNCFFVDFAIKTVCVFTPEFMKILVYFGIKTFFFGLLPQISWKLAHFLWWSPEVVKICNFLRWRPFFWSLPQISSNFAMNTFFLVHTLEFKEIKFSWAPKFVYTPPSRYPGAGPGIGLPRSISKKLFFW